MMARAGRWIPARAHGLRHPAVAWTYALPLWILLALAMSWAAPAAAYLWTLPLLAAGLLLVRVPPSQRACRPAGIGVDPRGRRHAVAARHDRPAAFHRRRARPAAVRHPGLRLPGADRGRRPDDCAAVVRRCRGADALLRPSLATALALAGVAATVLRGVDGAGLHLRTAAAPLRARAPAPGRGDARSGRSDRSSRGSTSAMARRPAGRPRTPGADVHGLADARAAVRVHRRRAAARAGAGCR